MQTTLPGATSAGAHPSHGSFDIAGSAATVDFVYRLPDMATYDMLNQLPALDDDNVVGVEMEHLVRRDGDKDIRFTGTLLASAAPESKGQARWWEYRVYETTKGSYIFSKIGRSIHEQESDKFEAQIWTPPTNWTTWEKEMVRYFEFDALAKQLYEKLGVDTAERLD